jgi:hypothetical protein
MPNTEMADMGMSELSAAAWGHPDRYYSARIDQASSRNRQFGEQDSRRWAEVLEKASPGIRETVERTYKQWNTILRDYLRNETALRLTVGSETQSVPVRVVSGMPCRFAEVMRNLEGLEWLLLNRSALVAASSGTSFMAKHVDRIRDMWGEKAGPSKSEEIVRVKQTAEAWLNELEKVKAVEKIIGINEDVLGAYFFRVPEIRLYWIVIGITAGVIGVSAEALTIVTLAHELAHAYTHLGRDIDNERWNTEGFAAAELDIIEGLAQFYTAVLCRRLMLRMPTAIEAYDKLLEKQSGFYRAHIDWGGNYKQDGEIIHVSMIECRSQGIRETHKFKEAIRKYRDGIRGQRKK